MKTLSTLILAAGVLMGATAPAAVAQDWWDKTVEEQTRPFREHMQWEQELAEQARREHEERMQRYADEAWRDEMQSRQELLEMRMQGLID